MSLDNIQLPSVVLQELFNNSLVDLKTGQAIPRAAAGSSFNVLGNNKKQVLIITANRQTAFLPDEDLKFLTGILAACKLTMEDIALVNSKKNKGFNYQTFNDQLKPRVVLIFGVPLPELELPFEFPHYQVQRYNDQVYLYSPDLPALQHNIADKTKLWNCLKQIFSI